MSSSESESEDFAVDTTLLVISVMGVPEYSARGLSQSLEPINQAQNMRRTVNGNLHDISAPQFRKYHSAVSCTDQQAPSLDGIWPGMLVEVDCVAELSYPIGGTPERTVVEGSSRTESEFVFYRPRLSMRIVSYNETKDEYGATTAWSLELEEI